MKFLLVLQILVRSVIVYSISGWRGFTVVRFYSGAFVTSLDGHGISISVLKLIDDSWLEYLGTLHAVS